MQHFYDYQKKEAIKKVKSIYSSNNTKLYKANYMPLDIPDKFKSEYPGTPEDSAINNNRSITKSDLLNDLLLADVELDSLIKALKQGKSFGSNTKIIEQDIPTLVKFLKGITRGNVAKEDPDISNVLGYDFESYYDILESLEDADYYLTNVDKDTILSSDSNDKTLEDILESFYQLYKEFYALYTNVLTSEEIN